MQDCLSGTHDIPPEHQWAKAIFLEKVLVNTLKNLSAGLSLDILFWTPVYKLREENTVTFPSRKFSIHSQHHRLPTFDDDGGGIKYQ